MSCRKMVAVPKVCTLEERDFGTNYRRSFQGASRPNTLLQRQKQRTV